MGALNTRADFFSKQDPELRLVWSATTLEAYMRDPLTYYWKHVLGYVPLVQAPALVWGSLWHMATALFKQLTEGRDAVLSRDEALFVTIEKTICEAQKIDLNDIARNGKKSDINKRTMYTLIRSLIWWEANYRDDSFRTADTGAVCPLEQHFMVPLGIKAYTGEDYLITGVLDEIVADEDGDQFVLERKHTTQTISSYYFNNYDPSVQVYTYDLVGSLILPHNPLRGVVIESCQTAVGFSRFERHEVLRTQEQRNHWLNVLRHWIRRAEQDCTDRSWQNAMNPATTIYDSVYRDIETKSPSSWASLLKSEFTTEKPL